MSSLLMLPITTIILLKVITVFMKPGKSKNLQHLAAIQHRNSRSELWREVIYLKCPTHQKTAL